MNIIFLQSVLFFNFYFRVLTKPSCKSLNLANQGSDKWAKKIAGNPFPATILINH